MKSNLVTINAPTNSHTRNKKVDWTTCETCPTEVKSVCSSICSEMERYLASNGNTITHNSPTERQSMKTVADMTDTASSQEAGNVRSLSSIMATNKYVANMDNPEVLMLRTEANEEATSALLSYIYDFSVKVAKTDERKRSMVESILTLHYLEGYNSRRIAEILGERFDEFKGYQTVLRKSGAKAGYEYTKPKGDDKVWRYLERFKTFVQSTHLSDSIKKVMETGSIGHLKSIAVA